MANSSTDPNSNNLDAFLTTVESKLRAPFSALEIAKAMQQQQQRDSDAASEYVQRLAAVLHQTDKITQLRILVGLLGIEASPSDNAQHEQDEQVRHILEQAQENPTYEEWVRVIAGLVQGIMFEDDDDEQNEENNTEEEYDEMDNALNTSRGEEANELLSKTCDTILESVSALEQETAKDKDPQAVADADPTFCPYRYALIPVDLLHQVIPETASHSHFQVNTEASILTMDEQQDQKKKSLEEKDRFAGTAARPASASKTKAAAAASMTPTFPGFRSGSKTAAAAAAKSKAQRPKTSMFVSARKPVSVARTTGLHARKKGAAQRLVGKGRMANAAGAAGGAAAGATDNKSSTNLANRRRALMAAAGGGSRTGGVRGRAMSSKTGAGGAKSKMMMIDVREVQGLADKDAAAQQQLQKGKHGKLGQKRKAGVGLMEQQPKSKKLAAATDNGTAQHMDNGNQPQQAAAAAAASSTPTAAAPNTNNTAANMAAGALVSAALSAYQAQQKAPPPAAAAPAPAAAAGTTKQDWRQMLETKSNKLSADDRFRIQQFFQDRHNPTPDVTSYKMKLHEQRTDDPVTGKPVMKETYYLELDYTTFTSKQSKKTKRY